MLPSLCDHDLYGGLGNPYPNNPNWQDHPDGPDTVDGLLATMAAIDFTARGNDALDGYDTSWFFLHGTSAGSAGAYHVAHAFDRSGVRLNGALLDAYVVSPRLEDIMGQGCTPQEAGAAKLGLTFDPEAAAAKVGPFLVDEALLAENTLGKTHHTPLFDLVGAEDQHCCGHVAPVPAAAAAGFDNNCRYVHEPLAGAMAAQPQSAHHRSLVVDGLGHVISGMEAPHQDALQRRPAPAHRPSQSTTSRQVIIPTTV